MKITNENRQQIMKLIHKLVIDAGNHRWAEVEELQLQADSSVGTVEDRTISLNDTIQKLWSAIGFSDETPKEILMTKSEEEEEECSSCCKNHQEDEECWNECEDCGKKCIGEDNWRFCPSCSYCYCLNCDKKNDNIGYGQICIRCDKFKDEKEN